MKIFANTMNSTTTSTTNNTSDARSAQSSSSASLISLSTSSATSLSSTSSISTVNNCNESSTIDKNSYRGNCNEVNKDSVSSNSRFNSTSNNDASSSGTIYPGWHNVVSGGIAGAGSRILTAPLDLIRIRRQLIVTYPTPSMYDQMSTIVRNEGGIPALYRGNVAAIYLWITYAAVQFTVFHSVKDYIVNLRRQQEQNQHYSTILHSNSNEFNNSNSKRYPNQNQQQKKHVRFTSLIESSAVVSFLSGAVAGLTATAATYPFDVCRTAFVARSYASSSSSSPSTMKRPPEVTIITDRHWIPGTVFSPTSSSLSASSSTVITGTSPTGSSPPRTLTEFVYQMYRTSGIRGFYAGCFPALIQIVPYMGLNFAIYDFLTSSSGNNSNSRGSVFIAAYAGSISGGLSKLIIYPVDTVKRRMQAQAFYGSTSSSTLPLTMSSTNSPRIYYYHGMLDCFYKIATTEGFFSFYRGIVPSVLKTTISTSLTFALYRWSKNLLQGIHDHVDLVAVLPSQQAPPHKLRNLLPHEPSTNMNSTNTTTKTRIDDSK